MVQAFRQFLDRFDEYTNQIAIGVGKRGGS